VTSAILFQKVGLFVGIMPIIAVAVVAGFLLIYYNLELSLLLTLTVSIFLHTGIGTGTVTPITFTFILIIVIPIVWFFRMVMVEKSFKIHALPANRPALLFMIVVIIAAIWSGAFADNNVRFLFNDKLNPRLMTVVSFISSILVYFLVANHIRSLSAMRFFVACFIAAGGIMAIMRLTTGTVIAPLNGNGQFSAFVVILAMGQVLYNKNISRLFKGVLFLIALAWFYIGYSLGITWLSGWLPIAIGAGVMFAMRSWKSLIICVAVIAIYIATNAEFLSTTMDAENAESGEARTEAWGRTFDLLEDHFLFGTGPAGYYYYFTVNIGGFFQLSHNNFVDILSQAGIVGFALYIWMWLAIGLTIFRMYRTLPRQGFLYGLGISLIAAYIISLVSMFLGDWVTPFTYTQSIFGIDYTIWHWMMAGLAGAVYFYNQESNQSQSSINTSMPIPGH
jgi:hypothetical protein